MVMRYLRLVVLSLGLLTLAPVLFAQSPQGGGRTQATAVIEQRLKAQQPVKLSADSITLNGTVLELKGHVRIVLLPDTLIRAEEARVNGSTVELIGDVNAVFGPSSGVPHPFPPPRIEFR
jgi:hypothetical protein